MTEAMPFLQKHDITFLRPPPIRRGIFICRRLTAWDRSRRHRKCIFCRGVSQNNTSLYGRFMLQCKRERGTINPDSIV